MMHLIFLILFLLPSVNAKFEVSSPITRKTRTISRTAFVSDNVKINKALNNVPRGGASGAKKASDNVSGVGGCKSDIKLFAEIGLSALVETAGLVGFLAGAQKLSSQYSLPEIFGVDIIIWLSLLLIVFASSFFSSIIDGGISAATAQVLSPSQVPGESNWYTNLKKPKWNPPPIAFPIMWLIVSKPTQLAALITLFKSDKASWNIIALYCAHLSLGDAWNKVFFELECLGRGTAVITLFLGTLLLSAYQFYLLDPNAGFLMLPTSAWVTVATALTWNIYLNN